MSNLLIQQYGKYKRQHLDENPYSCLLDTSIDINPHQVDAFCAAVKSLKTGGIILADEVGLGKTIEAGLVIKYVIKTGAKKILITLPASLRKQWEVELLEKFDFPADSIKILDRQAINFDPIGIVDHWLKDSKKLSIALTSYDFSSKLMKKYPSVKWDFVVIDEAHNMRNIFHGTKRAKRLYEQTHNIPKILLTATPLQNNLSDLHGLVSFIDPRIFGTEKAFNKQYREDYNYAELKQNLSPVLYRTLRKDVSKYMQFANRVSRTFDFELSYDEVALYMRVNKFLKRDYLYSLPTANRNLLTLVIRKLLASSSFALIETFEVILERLQKLLEGTKSKDAQEGFELFWNYLDDDYDEDAEEEEDADVIFQKQQIQEEIDEVTAIIDNATKIKTNAKIKALKQAIETAFAMQQERGIAEKVVIFTESKRTQKYVAKELIASGIDEEDIVLFNGENTDSRTKEIYRAYQVKNFGKTNYGPAVERKHAIVDYFEHNAKILILTDAGSEGLNLQFCNTVINYDLPWNPMKIEQRIGRCHRYGQKNDVVAINLLNTGNAADMRVYEILSKKFELFDGVFGSSDIALGILESGINFEQEILAIYQKCNTAAEIRREFDKLDRKLDAKRNKKARELREILLSKTSEQKCAELDAIKIDIDKYLRQEEYWRGVEDEDLGLPVMNIWKTPNWGEDVLGSHGWLFVGALCDNTKLLFPVLLLCDEQGRYVDFDEDDLLPSLEQIDDTEIFSHKLTVDEQKLVNGVYDKLLKEMLDRYNAENQQYIAYQRQKLENWAKVQEEQLMITIGEVTEEAEEIMRQAEASKNFYEKVDLKKKAQDKLAQAKKLIDNYHQKVSQINEEVQREIEEFEKHLIVNPILLFKIVLKF
ncbi:MAG: DISARM system SNF2-like helicase DrmD [Clostridia bacterium]|nr:DISARM system SNF2-like helicase DrmD [Clostridia bacterium]